VKKRSGSPDWEKSVERYCCQGLKRRYSRSMDIPTLSVHDSSRVRGRTMERVGSGDRSTSRVHGGDGNLCRFSSRELTAEPDEMDDSRRSSLSPVTFGGHRDAFALILLAQKRRHEFPVPVFQDILKYVTHADYLTLRLVCRQWSGAVSQCRPPKIASVFYSPTEILQQILGYLGPFDFNAARHTSKAWMVARLDRKPLTLMIRRGGWSKVAEEDLLGIREQEGQGPLLSEEWLLSKRLTTECMLSAECRVPPTLSISTTVDFSDLGNGYGTNRASVNFTVSGCGNFVLVAEGCMVYIYQLLNTRTARKTFGPPLRPVTSIICPRRVLAVSMDTSAQRFAMAALLEGRMGLVCDIHSLHNTRSTPDTSAQSRSTAGQRDSMTRQDNTFHRASVRSTLSYGERTITEPALSNFKSPIRPIPASGIPIESGARSLYRNLCSNEDLPRSVAICPQRRCVAFGCSAGIELHWIDALTGQDLNRWFPLAAPPDFLYFLPPRRGVDSAKKLRLISSAAYPHERSSVMNRFHPSHTHPPFLGDIPVPFPSTSLRAVDCDHYRALPLSDGFHMLFTDPTTSLLCLGSDAPLGGPTKLLRGIMMIPPPSVEITTPPSVYAAGVDLRYGVRVVAAYVDRVILYSIPIDIFEAAKLDQHTPTTPSFAESVWQDYYFSTSASPGNDPASASLWPVRINGLEIGIVEGVVDFAIKASQSISIWAFRGRGGEAIVFDLGFEGQVNKSVVLADGGVFGMQDREGDVEMYDLDSEVAGLGADDGDGEGGLDAGGGREGYNALDGAGLDGVSLALEFPNRSINVLHLPPVPGSGNPNDVEIMNDQTDTTSQEFPHGQGAARAAELTNSSLFDLQIPSLEAGWDGDDVGGEAFLMEYLGAAQSGNEMLRVLGFERLELEVL
jgi:hypothetical protein